MSTLEERALADSDDSDRFAKAERDYPAAISSFIAQTRALTAMTAERDAARAEASRLRQVLFEALASFTHETHPGRDCRQSGHIAVEIVAKWRAALEPTQPKGKP